MEVKHMMKEETEVETCNKDAMEVKPMMAEAMKVKTCDKRMQWKLNV